MRLVIVSDTHGLHNKLSLPNGDVLIHCGDITAHGTRKEAFNFLDWFSKQRYRHKIFIAGNHDYCLDPDKTSIPVTKEEISNVSSGITYLNHETVVIDNVKFYGHPYTPYYQNMAFNSRNLYHEQTKIPSDVDILITHGPPKGILDLSLYLEHLGSESLYHKVKSITPKLHVFGHIHEAYGRESRDQILFVNAAVHTGLWRGETNTPPQIIDL